MNRPTKDHSAKSGDRHEHSRLIPLARGRIGWGCVQESVEGQGFQGGGWHNVG
jgi:hypothetical protein